MALHLARVILLAVALLPLQFAKPVSETPSTAWEAVRARIDDELLNRVYGPGTRLAEAPLGEQLPALDPQGKVIGRVIATLPTAADVIGYRGPTNVALLLDEDYSVVAADIVSSRDTEEHVAAIEDEAEFWPQYYGWQLGNIDPKVEIDAVSGATLTSLAVAEAIMLRLGGGRPSLEFPAPLELQEVAVALPAAKRLVESEAGSPVSRVLDADNEWIATAVRSGPLVDSILGYQGPSELLLIFSPSDQLLDAQLRTTYDNEPYVDYVREEAGFWKLFRGQSIERLAERELDTSGIEGVSGATMTSLAVAETLFASSRKLLERRSQNASTTSPSIRWTPYDTATITMVGIGVFLIRRLQHRRPRLRVLWLITCFALLGLVTGNLLSLALFAGWSTEGVAWRLAPGLTLLLMAAVLIPPLTKRNVYCHQLCPHGAAQQLIRRRFAWQWHPSRRTTQLLSSLPGLLLAVAYLLLVIGTKLDYAGWEPFHAYLWRHAPLGMLIFAGATLLFAALVPMGYCRFGCPTGRLLDYVRRSSATRVTLADLVLVAAVIFAWCYRSYL